ncbi:beta-mannanase/endoglucanase A-like [Scylla paramamosain]|uniref:beta-mannanase/endoglucanase A-like n=1 Tax=Scylla paramamosain TaxID=85552 RepID=UPI0030829DA2
MQARLLAVAVTVAVVMAMPMPQLTAQPTPQLTAQPTPQLTAQPTPQLTAQSTPQLTAQPTPQVTPQPSTQPRVTLEEAFMNRTSVEAVVDCFIDNTRCDAEQVKIRERAMAAMMNMGRCPATLCTEQQQLEMTRAMELLQEQHKDLWIKLLISMFDLDLP